MHKPIAILLLCAALPANAQQSAPFDFSIRNIMRGPELYGRPPANVRWSADSKWIYFTWLEPGTNWREQPKQFRVRAVPGSKPERVSLQQVDSAGPRFAESERSHNGRYAAVEFNGDIFINDLTSGTTRRLTQTVEAERSPQFSANDREILFVRNNNVYSVDLANGFTRQLTDVRQGPPVGDSAPPAGQRGRLEEQQRALFESVRDRIRADSIARAERLQRDSLGLHPIYLQSGEMISDFSISPTTSSLLISTRSPAAGNRTTDIPQYVTRSGYTEELRSRTKVGDAQQKGLRRHARQPCSVTVLGADLERPVTNGGLDRRAEPRARRVHPPTLGAAGHPGELLALPERLGGPLHRGVVVTVLLHQHPGQAVQAGHLGQPCPGVEALVLDRLRGGGREGGHQALPAVETSDAASSSAFLARFCSTSARQNSLALVVSTSNSKRSTISGATSALST